MTIKKISIISRKPLDNRTNFYYLKTWETSEYYFYDLFFETSNEEKAINYLKSKNEIVFANYNNKKVIWKEIKFKKEYSLNITPEQIQFKYLTNNPIPLSDVLTIRNQIKKGSKSHKFRQERYKLNIFKGFDGSFNLLIQGYSPEFIMSLYKAIKKIINKKTNEKPTYWDLATNQFIISKEKNQIKAIKKALLKQLEKIIMYPKDLVLKKGQTRYIVYKKSDFQTAYINSDYAEFLYFFRKPKNISKIIAFFKKKGSNWSNAIDCIHSAICANFLTFDSRNKGGIRKIKVILPYNLDLITYEITKKCNLKCIHCYNESDIQKKEKNFNLSDFSKSLETFKKIGVFDIYFTGGEPLIYPNFKQVIKETVKRGLWYSIFTNGSLITPDWIKFFKRYPPRYFIISLDTVSENQFFKIRKQAVKKIMQNIKLLKKHGFVIRINTVLFENINNSRQDLEKLFLFCRDNDIDKIIIDPLELFGRGKNLKKYKLKNNKKTILDIDKSFKKIFHKPFFSKNRIYKSNTMCGVAINRLFVNSGGNITLCPLLNEKDHVLGNITNSYKQTKKLWLNNELLTYIREKRYLNKKCKKCNFVAHCYGGCIGKSWQKDKGYGLIDGWSCNKMHFTLKKKSNKF